MSKFRITANDILGFAAQLQLKGNNTLNTFDKQAKFTFEVKDSAIIFTPDSKKKPRLHEFKYLQNVCRRFSTTKSLKKRDYNIDSRNASYTLALIVKYLSNRVG